jgi:hypothetical protein
MYASLHTSRLRAQCRPRCRITSFTAANSNCAARTRKKNAAAALLRRRYRRAAFDLPPSRPPVRFAPIVCRLVRSATSFLCTDTCVGQELTSVTSSTICQATREMSRQPQHNQAVNIVAHGHHSLQGLRESTITRCDVIVSGTVCICSRIDNTRLPLTAYICKHFRATLQCRLSCRRNDRSYRFRPRHVMHAVHECVLCIYFHAPFPMGYLLASFRAPSATAATIMQLLHSATSVASVATGTRVCYMMRAATFPTCNFFDFAACETFHATEH